MVLFRTSGKLLRELEAVRIELIASEEQFRRALIESPIPSMLHAEDGAILQLSRSWYELTGYGPEEMRTVKDWTERAYRDRKEAVRAGIDRLYELEKRIHEGDFEIQIRDGSTRIWEFSTSPLGRLPDGRRLVLSVAQDVTERRRAEDALRESEEITRAIVENATDFIIVVSEERITYINRAGLRLLRARTREEIVGHNPLEFLHPEYHALARGHIAQLLGSPGSVIPSLPEKVVALDGTVIDVEVYAVSYLGQGKVQFQVTARAITEQLRAEQEIRASKERFRTLVAAAPIGIFLQARRRFAYVNSAALELLNCQCPAELLGQPVLERFHPDDRAAVSERTRLINEERQPVESRELRILRLDGIPIACEAKAVPFRIDREDGALAFLWDITARKVVERALADSTEQLHELTRRLLNVQEAQRRALARELHDEIGQAMTAVKIDLQMVLRSQGDPTGRVEDAIAVAGCLLEQIRGMALDLRPSLLDDLGLCAALSWYVRRFAERTGLDGQFQSEPEEFAVPPEIATACFWACQEALTNVARHAQASRFRVELLGHGAGLELIIRDNGLGFDPTDAMAHATAGGTFGLLGIRERVELAGGQIAFRSQPGEGTEIRLIFTACGNPASLEEAL